MARLCDPDINMITIGERSSPEPAIRDMIIYYYVSNGLTRNQAFDAMVELLSKHDEICNKFINQREAW
jgi:hypothetical protein